MSGLNFLLWTIAALLILGAVTFIAVCIYGIHVRKRAMKEWQDRPSFADRLNEAKAQREELLKHQNKK